MVASRFSHLAVVTLHCPSCKASLNVPKTLLGFLVDCPSCDHSFVAKEPPPDPNAVDELALHSPLEDAKAQASDATMIEFCPACNVKWIKGEVSCKKCLYNVVLMRRMKDFTHKGAKFSIDTTKIFLLLLAGAVAFGIYWLGTNFQWLKSSGQEAYDNASKGMPVETPSNSSKQGKVKD